MRRILTDDARARHTHKRNDDALTVTLDSAAAVCPSASADVLAVDQALDRLARIDERKARVVELRYFGGLGTILAVSPSGKWLLVRAQLPGGEASSAAVVAYPVNGGTGGRVRLAVVDGALDAGRTCSLHAVRSRRRGRGDDGVGAGVN